MRKIKDVLRLKLEAKLSHERIADALGISKGVVAKYASLAAAAGLDWPTVQSLTETALERHLVGGRADRPSQYVPPDFGRVHQELRRKGMTLMLLWQEYVEDHPGQSTWRYSQFCENSVLQVQYAHRPARERLLHACGVDAENGRPGARRVR